MLDLDDDEDEDFKMVPPYKKPPTSRIDRKVYHTAGIVPVLQDGSGGDMFTARADTFFKTFYQEAHQVEAEDEVPATKRQTIREEKTQEIKPKFLFDNLDFRPTILSVAANFSGAPTNKTHSESPVIPLTMDVVIISDDQEELITKRKGLRRRNKKQIDLGSDDCTLIENTSSIDLKSLEKKDSNSIKIPNKSSIHLTTRKDPHDEGTFVSVTLYPTLNAIQLGVQSELLSMGKSFESMFAKFMNSFIHFEDLAFNLDSLQFVFEGIRVFPWNTPQDLLMKGQILFPNNIMEIYALESEVAKDKLGNPLFWNMYCQEIKVLLETPIFSLENEENRKELQVEDEKESFVLSLKGPNGIILKIPFEENLPLNQLEKQYKELMKLQPAALICFYFDGEKLEMNKTPADCELEHEDCIEVRMI